MGISADLLIYNPKDKDITVKEMDDFIDDLEDITIKKGWVMGGGFNLVDANKEDADYDFGPTSDKFDQPKKKLNCDGLFIDIILFICVSIIIFILFL